MHKWEYLYILRSRSWEARREDQGWHEGGSWTSKIFQATGEKAYPYKNLQEALSNLGDLGWELVAVSPRSSAIGGTHAISGSIGIASADIRGATTDYAGFTSQEIWVFKRPKR